MIRVDPNRPYIYVSNEDDNIVSVLDYERRTRRVCIKLLGWIIGFRYLDL